MGNELEFKSGRSYWESRLIPAVGGGNTIKSCECLCVFVEPNGERALLVDENGSDFVVSIDDLNGFFRFNNVRGSRVTRFRFSYKRGVTGEVLKKAQIFSQDAKVLKRYGGWVVDDIFKETIELDEEGTQVGDVEKGNKVDYIKDEVLGQTSMFGTDNDYIKECVIAFLRTFLREKVDGHKVTYDKSFEIIDSNKSKMFIVDLYGRRDITRSTHRLGFQFEMGKEIYLRKIEFYSIGKKSHVEVRKEVYKGKIRVEKMGDMKLSLAEIGL